MPVGPKPYEAKHALPLPSDAEIDKVLGASYDPDAVTNVVKMLAGTHDLCDAMLGLVRAVFMAEGVDPKLRQVIILRAATVLNAPYEWQVNVPLSLNHGLTFAEIDAIGLDGPVAGIHGDYMLLCRATDELSKHHTLTDLTLSALRTRFGDVMSRKFVLIIAWFNLLDLFVNGCRVPLESREKIGMWRTAPSLCQHACLYVGFIIES